MREALAAQMLTMGLPRLETSKQGDFLGAALAASGYNAYTGSEAVRKIWRGKVNNFLVNSLKTVKSEALERLRAGKTTTLPPAAALGTGAPGTEERVVVPAVTAPSGTPQIVTPSFTPVNAGGSGGFTPVNSGGFTPVNGGFTPVNKRSRDSTPIFPNKKELKEGDVGKPSPDPWRQLEDQVLLEQLDAALVAILTRGSADALKRAEKIVRERFGAVQEPDTAESSQETKSQASPTTETQSST